MRVRRRKLGFLALFLAVVIALGGASWFAVDVSRSHNFPAGPVENTEQLTDFSAFPAYWLGASYNGLPLTQLHVDSQGVSLGYGYCKTPGGFLGLYNYCTPPLGVAVVSPCRYPQQPYALSAPGPRWASSVGVHVTNVPPGMSVEKIIEDLTLANARRFPLASQRGTDAAVGLDDQCPTPAM